jgi:hypothetical protein
MTTTSLHGAPPRGHARRAVSGWRPVYGHPAGPSEYAWFTVMDNGQTFPTVHHPCADEWTLPWYAVRGPFVYQADGHPDGPAPAPSFEIVGSFLYLAPPDLIEHSRPWYQMTRPW